MQKLILLATCMIFVSCKDFTENKLSSGPNLNKDVQGNQEILGDLSNVNSGSFSIDKLILNTGLNVVFPAVVEFHQKIEKLDSTIDLYCEVLRDADSQNDLAIKKAIQNYWKESMDAYHKMEAFKFGPIMNNGEELGLSLYSWPLQNACRVELEIAKNTTKTDYQLKAAVNLKGLGALETILFTENGKHNCASVPDFLASWLNSSPKQKKQDQCYYMSLVSEDLLKQSTVLKKTWDPKHGNFIVKQIKNENNQKKLSVLNEISNSLFYVETILKDQKLGAPSGIMNCNFNSCPEKSEHIIAKYSIPAIIQNLIGFKNVFNGIDHETQKNGFGIDDYLADLGHPQVAKDMNNALNNVISSFLKHKGITSLHELAQGIDKSQCLSSSSENRAVEICALYFDVRTLTTILKNDYILALRDIQGPKESQGDMD